MLNDCTTEEGHTSLAHKQYKAGKQHEKDAKTRHLLYDLHIISRVCNQGAWARWDLTRRPHTPSIAPGEYQALGHA